MKYSFKSILLIFLLPLLCTQAKGQQDSLEIVFASFDSTSVVNGQVDVEVRVRDFEDILATQFTVLWDSTVLEIVEIPYMSQDLPGLNIASFSLPYQTASMTKGRMAHTWFSSDAQAKSLPYDHHLFTMRFKAIGEECSSTQFELLEAQSYKTEITNSQFVNIGATYNDLPILITGEDCGEFTDILACNTLTNISLNSHSSETTISAEAILEGGPYDYSVIELDPMTVNCDNIGDTIQVTATHMFSGNSCWGLVTVADLTGPVAVLDDEFVLTLNGFNGPDPFEATLNVKDLDAGSFDNCSDSDQLVFDFNRFSN